MKDGDTLRPEQVPELLVDEFRARADTAELLSRDETRAALAAVLGRWEESRGSSCLWETVGAQQGTRDRDATPVISLAGILHPGQYTLVLQRCANCLAMRVQSLPGHWSDTQVGVTGGTP